MGLQPKRWITSTVDTKTLEPYQEQLGLCRAVAQVLYNRGISVEEADTFLNPKLSDLRDPMEIGGMEAAVKRIWEAVKNDEKILVHGDFDTDGITSTALLTWVLRSNGAHVDSYLPNRIDDGYGLSAESIEKGVDGHSLIITVDCGITSFDGAEAAKQRGVDIIITDHHQPEETCPDVYAIVNPKLEPENKHIQPLAGVGVCFKLCHALLKYGRENGIGGWKPELREGIDLVALGTVADIVPLVGENRRLVSYGMRILSSQHRPGIHALCEVSGIDQILKTEDIAFRLAPRLNAAGRIGDAQDALNLLTTESIVESYRLAKKLGEYNRQRQQHEEETYQAAIEMIQRLGIGKRNAIVVYGDDWHRGVIGIVASRLAQEFNRPTFVLTVDEDGTMNGSGRSIPGLDLVDTLDDCRDCTIRFGGHPMAVGLAIDRSRCEEFSERFDNAVQRRCENIQSMLPEISLEGQLDFSDLTDQFFKECEYLQPFGHQNPKPVFQFNNVSCRKVQSAGKNNARGVLTDDSGQSINFIFFGRRPNELPDGNWDVAAVPEINTFKGHSTPQLQLVDVRAAQA